jgi:glycerol-3-phosphate acyltransferase PlsY
LPVHEIIFLIGSYLIGAVPFGYLIYFFTTKKDIRGEGSGNIGATNVLRSKGKAAGLATLALDLLKGALPVIYALKFFDNPTWAICGGAAAVLGHVFPVYLKFRGGKGVATYLGAVLAFSPPVGLTFIAFFLAALLITRYVSAGSLAGVAAVFFHLLFTQIVEVAMVVLPLVVVITARHSSNLKRIFSGKENKLNLKKNG